MGLILLVSVPSFLYAQDTTHLMQSYIFFPYPIYGNKWHSSIGFTLTQMPRDITEEVQVRAPAGDYHVTRKLFKGFYLDGRINFQIVQNHFSLGPRWAYILNNRFSFSVGDDFAWWFGNLNVGDFKTKANGWLNYPNASIGYRIRRSLLLTLKMEGTVNLSYFSKVGDQLTSYSHNTYTGWAASLILEQPFYKRNNFILGFRAQYTNFFWQTWSLYETFDRKLFYPEVIIGFIL